MEDADMAKIDSDILPTQFVVQVLVSHFCSLSRCQLRAACWATNESIGERSKSLRSKVLEDG